MRHIGRLPRVALGVVAAALVGLAIFLAWAHRPAIAPIAPPAPGRFAAADVARGEALAHLGGCLSCHQSAHGRPYAGGYGVKSPFGTIYGSNITPEPETGIGQWSEAAFARALREGVGRDGRHLYPALPYDHFTQLTDADLHALYAFVMTRPPVRAVVPANKLIPPLGFRPLIAGWKLLFFRPGAGTARQNPALPPDAGPELRRGAYLGEALAHCGACHTPRGVLGNEQRARAYQGGWSDGWYAPPMDRHSPAVRSWTRERLIAYLATGLEVHHAASAGPMGTVSRNLSQAPPADVAALATYYAWLMRDAPAARREPALPDRQAEAAQRFPGGAALYAGACATCHEPGAPMMVAGRPALPLGTPLHEDTPRDTIQIVLQGLNPPVGPRGPYMPAFATLKDQDVAALVNYLQARHGTATGSAWNPRRMAHQVARARKDGE